MTPLPLSLNHVEITTPVPEDVHALERFFRNVITDTFKKEGIGLLHESIAEEVEDKMQLFQTYMDSKSEKPPSMRFLVARFEGQIIATLTYGPSGPWIRRTTKGALSGFGELGSAYVLPEYQRRGVSSKMIEKMLQKLQEDGIQTFIFDSGYVEAQRIWARKFGAPWKVIPDHWGPDRPHMIWRCQVEDHLNHRSLGETKEDRY